VADFVEGAKALLPEVEEKDLQLGYSGLRPKIVPPEATDAHGDFVIMRDPKVPQAIQLVGIESPGLTSAPSIAEHVAQLAAEVLA
jgi:glycerol-3-phosphate dehydrogenase